MTQSEKIETIITAVTAVNLARVLFVIALAMMQIITKIVKTNIMAYIERNGQKERVQPEHNGTLNIKVIDSEIVVVRKKKKDATDEALNQLFKHDLNPTK